MVEKNAECRFKGDGKDYDWEQIRDEFDKYPTPTWARDEDYKSYNPAWIFRGHKVEKYRLEPSIERDYGYEWAATEAKVLREFKSKAKIYIDPAQIPQSEDTLGWLAFIQHYGAPTRLLDFTYSPYVALYFALRNWKAGEAEDYAEVWGIDACALREQADKMSREADRKVQEQKEKPHKRHRASFLDSVSLRQGEEEEERIQDALIRNALDPCVIRRRCFNDSGFIALALPSLHNPRLSSQQGVFLFNGAEDHLFEESLELMMQNATQQWYMRFRIPARNLKEIEKRLFQLNIHELSLFPDLEGLVGFVQQKTRLHLSWLHS